MAELKNPKHEKFVQNIVRGLSPTEAYISAGYSGKGAHASAARLLKNPEVCTRLTELQKVIAPLVEAAIVKLIVTERFQRSLPSRTGGMLCARQRPVLPARTTKRQ